VSDDEPGVYMDAQARRALGLFLLLCAIVVIFVTADALYGYLDSGVISFGHGSRKVHGEAAAAAHCLSLAAAMAGASQFVAMIFPLGRS
jgi:hypothetical protein